MHTVVIFMFLHSSPLDLITKSTALKSDFNRPQEQTKLGKVGGSWTPINSGHSGWAWFHARAVNHVSKKRDGCLVELTFTLVQSEAGLSYSLKNFLFQFFMLLLAFAV